MAQICRTMVAFSARASALQAWNTWIVPDTIRQSTRIHRVRAPACGRRTYLHRNRAWGIVKWPHVITATDARGEAAGPARRNSRRRSGSVPGRPRRCQIFGGGPVGRAGLLARNRGISIALPSTFPTKSLRVELQNTSQDIFGYERRKNKKTIYYIRTSLFFEIRMERKFPNLNSPGTLQKTCKLKINRR